MATQLNLAPDEIASVERAARVHDLGKLVIDLSVLNKNEPLSAEEWELFRRHPADGANILTWFPEFNRSTAYVRHHHERWDGRGYPDGLSGASIPFGARILAVADSLDAMSSARPYRAPLTQEAILAEFTAYRGVQWDAAVVDALFALIDSGAIDLAGDGESTRVYDGLGTVIQNN
ncbi:MAG: HD domain-containing phosphohydrolase [Thermomicrobiales bacterium]